MMDNFETEMVIMASRVAMQQYKLMPKQDKVERFEEYFQRYGKLLLDSQITEGESVDQLYSFRERTNIRFYGLDCKDWTPSRRSRL